MPAILTLRRLLLIDAASCAVMGVVLVGATGPLATLTMISSSFLFGTGLLLIAVAVIIAIVARPQTPVRAGVFLVVAGNIGWVTASLGVIGLGILAPNAFGTAIVVTQAIAVAVLTVLEWAAASRHGAGVLGIGRS